MKVYSVFKGKSFSPPSKTATFLPVYLDVLKQAAVLFVLCMYVYVCNPQIVLFFIFLEGDKLLLSTLKL